MQPQTVTSPLKCRVANEYKLLIHTIMKTISYMKKHKANEFYIKKSRGYYMVIDGYDNSMASLETTEAAAEKLVAELNKTRGNRLNIV